MELKEIFPKIKSILFDWNVVSEVENILILSYNLKNYSFNIMITPWSKDTIDVSMGCFLGEYVYSDYNIKFSTADELEKYLKRLGNVISDDLVEELNTDLKIAMKNTFRSRVNG